MDDIIDYIMQSPENTNPNVLRDMLENNNGGSGINSMLNVQMFYEETKTGARTYLDHTWQEIWDAYPFINIITEEEGNVLKLNWFQQISRMAIGYSPDEPGGTIYFVSGLADNDLLTSSPDGIPEYTDDNEEDDGETPK